MKLIACTAAAMVALVPAAFAQTAPAPAPAPAATAAPTVALTLDTPIETLVADPKAKAVLDAHVPGIETHPSYEMFKAMSLRAVQPFSQGKLTDELLAKIATDLAAIH